MFGSTYLCEHLFALMKRKKKDLRNTSINIYHFVINNDSSRNRNVKPDNNKLSAHKRCQFLENIVIRDEISEQNPNG